MFFFVHFYTFLCFFIYLNDFFITILYWIVINHYYCYGFSLFLVLYFFTCGLKYWLPIGDHCSFFILQKTTYRATTRRIGYAVTVITVPHLHHPTTTGRPATRHYTVGIVIAAMPVVSTRHIILAGLADSCHDLGEEMSGGNQVQLKRLSSRPTRQDCRHTSPDRRPCKCR